MKAAVHPREKRLAEKQKVDAELTKARTQLVRLRSERDGMVIAMRKGELVRRQDCLLQLGFLITSFRARVMNFPHTLQRRLEGKTAHEIGEILRRECASLLTDLAQWPSRAVSPHGGVSMILTRIYARRAAATVTRMEVRQGGRVSMRTVSVAIPSAVNAMRSRRKASLPSRPDQPEERAA